MKQKFHIRKNVKDKSLLIQEYAVLTADSRKPKLPGLQDEDFSLLCEQTYEAEEVREATLKGKDELIIFLRNPDFFPIGVYMDLIAQTVIGMYASQGEQNENLIFDDKADLLGDSGVLGSTVDIENDKADQPEDDLDELLDDDSEYDGNHSPEDSNHKSFDEEEDY
jgi:hypothetical protein